MISEMPLLVFSLLAGTAAGAYVASAIFPRKPEIPEAGKRGLAWLFPLVVLGLLGLGLLGTLAHLQHPERFLNALANPLAMISEEAYWSMAFGVMVFIDLVVSFLKGACPRVIRMIGAIFALLLMTVTGIAYATSLGVAAWAGIATIPLFVFGDLALGFALYGVFGAQMLLSRPFSLTQIAIQACLAVSLVGFSTQLAGAGFDVLPIIISLVLGPTLSAVVGVLAMTKRMPSAVAAWVILAFTVVAGVVARYAFYAACPF